MQAIFLRHTCLRMMCNPQTFWLALLHTPRVRHWSAVKRLAAARSRMLPMVMQVWVHEQGDGRLDIIDGKQRITSLLSYLDGIFPRNQQRFALEASQQSEIVPVLADFQDH